jgi:hypothetical protein
VPRGDPVQDNKAIVHRFDDLVRDGDPDDLVELCTPDMVNHALAGARPPGLDGTREFLVECRRDPRRIHVPARRRPDRRAVGRPRRPRHDAPTGSDPMSVLVTGVTGFLGGHPSALTSPAMRVRGRMLQRVSRGGSGVLGSSRCARRSLRSIRSRCLRMRATGRRLSTSATSCSSRRPSTSSSAKA